jgi:hypothetical protein
MLKQKMTNIAFLPTKKLNSTRYMPPFNPDSSGQAAVHVNEWYEKNVVIVLAKILIENLKSLIYGRRLEIFINWEIAQILL